MLKEFGPPDRLVLAEVPNPRPAPGEVVIRVAVVGIQFMETQLRSGTMRGALGDAPLPVVLGKEIAGEVVAAGAGVDPTLVGSRVLATTAGTGGYAELAPAPVESLIPVPSGLDLRDAVALYRYGATAQGLVDAGRVTAGDRVLVQAAAGAVGTILVQLLKRTGAHVIGAARGEHKLALVKELGADQVVDYATADWTGHVRQVARGAVEVVYDHVGGQLGRESFALLATGSGRQIVYGFSSGQPLDVKPMELFGRGLTLTGFSAGLIWNRPAYARDLVTEILELAVAGEIKAVVGQSFPLEQAAEAHAAVESRGTVGKTLLIP
nr:zinc-binding dehydrogenase [Streptomyces albus]